MVLATGKLKHNASIDKRADCLKNGYRLILQWFQQQDTYRVSQQAVGWDEDTCRRLDKIASEAHSYVATKYELQSYENNWKHALYTQGRAL